MHYAVFVPRNKAAAGSGDDQGEDAVSSRICSSLTEALKVVKEFKADGARFKIFEDYSQALNFVSTGTESDSSPSVDDCEGQRSPSAAAAEEAGSDYPQPKRSDISALRKEIEKGDNDAASARVLSNPRYLVNCSGDTPTILFEGCRYNAMHVAAKAGNADFCRTVVDSLKSVDYLRRLYPRAADHVLEDLSECLLNSYLNTPEKGMNETPLHFASKHGHLTVVRLLLSVPGCKKNVTNRYGETPGDIACTRMSGSVGSGVSREGLKKEIMMCIEESVRYVPLYRAEDNSVLPLLQKPINSYPPYLLKRGCSFPVTADSPVFSPMRLAAFAGPLTRSRAELFYKEWLTKRDSEKDDKSYRSSSSWPLSFSCHVRRSDFHKGMERIGRQLAVRFNCPWLEYWDFLDAMVDLTSNDGLSMLNCYLCRVWRRVTSLGITGSPLHLRKSKAKKCLLVDFNEEAEEEQETDDLFVDAQDSDKKVDIGEVANRSDVSLLCDALRRLRFGNEDDESNGSRLSDDEEEFEDEFYTPPETPVFAFIHGPSPTKTDFDVYVALENVSLVDYPFAERWHRKVGEYSSQERGSWPATDSPRSIPRATRARYLERLQLSC